MSYAPKFTRRRSAAHLFSIGLKACRMGSGTAEADTKKGQREADPYCAIDARINTIVALAELGRNVNLLNFAFV